MATSYNLAPIPKWVIMNSQGTAAGGAKLYTYSSLNHVQQKAVYQDQGGSIPYTNPILFDLNGTAGPFYWQFNDGTPDNLYYLEVYDSDDNLLWTLDEYTPPGAGGGGTVTVYQSITNYIGNSVFIDHIDNTASPVGVTNLLIAPGNHKGFTPALINPIVGTYGVVGPDTRFVKNNTSATDQITFVAFAQADNFTGDSTPVDYLRYQCTVLGAAETFKAFQFPICQKVKNLNNQSMTFQCWAKVLATPVTLSVYSRQYFGSGTAPSAEVRTLAGTMSLTTSWQEFNIQFTMPSTAGKSVGTAGAQTDDDASYMQLEMPLNALCDVWFTKPTLHLGDIEPDNDFDNYDQIDAIIQTFRTGDVKTSLLSSVPGGWINMNDGFIGNVGSGALNRANKDTFQLYKTLWDGVTDVWAPVTGGRGATAQADFVANKTMRLPLSLGRALLGQDGQFGTSLTFTAVAATDLITVLSTDNMPTGTPVQVSNSGGGLPAPLLASTPYYVINISGTTLKLATTVDNALAGTAIDITSAGTGTQTMFSVLGFAFGSGTHTLISSELPDPISSTSARTNCAVGGSGVIEAGGGGGIGIIGNSGGNQPHSIMQPSTFMNVFIKL